MMNNHILIKDDRIEIEKEFAEKHLSIHALIGATLRTDTSYSWAITGDHFILYFELPSIFVCNLPALLNELYYNVPTYFAGMDLDSSGAEVLEKYIKHMNKDLSDK